MDAGQIIIGMALWLGVCVVAGTFVATTTNVAGAFSKGEARTPFDWLLWELVCTAFFFVIGQGIFWSIKFGVYVHQGGTLPGSG